MKIGGLQKFSLIDYPGKVSCVIFTQGCNFRCPFCYNRELVIPEDFREIIPEGELFDFLASRQSLLQGVAVTGGEPTLHADLPDFLRRIKDLGFSIKLDTNGSNPARLKGLLHDGLLDFIAMDIKGPLNKYDLLAGVAGASENIQESIALIQESGIGHFFRTTVVRPYLNDEDLTAAALLTGDSQYHLQDFSPRDTVLEKSLLDQRHYEPAEFEFLQALLEKRAASAEPSSL